LQTYKILTPIQTELELRPCEGFLITNKPASESLWEEVCSEDSVSAKMNDPTKTSTNEQKHSYHRPLIHRSCADLFILPRSGEYNKIWW
jgi:hypothetical protein